MKLTVLAVVLLISQHGILCDPHSQDDDVAVEANTKPNATKPFDREEFRKNFRDRLGHTWTMFDMPNLDFYILPFLNYSQSALEPHFTEQQVKYHWDGIVENHRKALNQVLKEWRENDPHNTIAMKSLVGILEALDRVPRKYYDRIRIHGGAYVNHALFFGLLSGNREEDVRFPTEQVRVDIELQFQTFFHFKAKFNIAASKIVGSGNVFLVRKPNGNLQIETMSENDTPLITGSYPLLVLDMWEHAWYLKHKHKRSPYADDWWMLVDWDQVGALNDFWEEYDKKKKVQANKTEENATEEDFAKEEL